MSRRASITAALEPDLTIPDVIGCPECGSLLDDATAVLHELREQLDAIKDESAKKTLQIRRLKALDDARLPNDSLYPKAIEILENWRELCHPSARELESPARVKPVLARLKGRGKPYSVGELKECIFGYSRFPFVIEGRRVPDGPPARRFIDAELIFRDPKHVDQGLALAAEAHRRQEVMPEPVREAVPGARLSVMGKTALGLVQFGFYVFPIAPRAKTPVTANGLNDATKDLERITKFWLRAPEHNVGIRCGIESELVVLDVDGDEGNESLRALEKRFEALPLTASVVTPRGGSHFYFRHPGVGEVRNTTGFPGPGLDIRGDGGYVLAPSSVGPNGKRYEPDERVPLAPMPRWLLKLLVERQSQPSEISRDYAEMVRKGVAQGERNSQLLSLTGHLWSHEHEIAEVFELVNAVNLAKCKPPLPAREVEKIVESVSRMRARQALKAVTS